MPFIPHTDEDVQSMLNEIGASSINDLFDEIPVHLRSGQLNEVPESRTEMEITRLMAERAHSDAGVRSFIGAGAYEHHIPAAVWDIVGRGEIMTAYTPYQAEASQGTLQTIYEYQSMMAYLTGMDVSNASLYDGASGLAEAVLMAVRANRNSKSHRILMPAAVHPHYRACVEAIVKNQDLHLVEIPYHKSGGNTALDSLLPYGGEDYAALVISQPNFFGVLEDVDALTNWAHENKMLVIAVVNPTSLALLKPPGEWGDTGADIVVGEGQPLGIPLSSGGPYFGFMCCKMGIVRQMPGRIIGRTVDLDGKPGFALTLQAREQHIRRAKATSNICTNQGLAMTAATLYLSLLGPDGLERVARLSHANTQALVRKLTAIDGVETVFTRTVFHEAVLRLPKPVDRVLEKLEQKNILGGIALAPYYAELDNCILICATETKNENDLDAFSILLADVLAEV